jgi:hypothetical protein
MDKTPTSWEEHRRRMLRETEAFIEWGLAHPDEVIDIPAKPVGEGGFPAEVGKWFWNVVLAEKVDSTISRFRSIFRGRRNPPRTGRWRR